MLDFSKYSKLIEAFTNLIQNNEATTVDKVQDIIKENNEMRNNQSEICDQLKLNSLPKIAPKICSLLQLNSILSSLCQMLNINSISQIQPTIKVLLDFNQQYNELNGLFPR